MSKQFFHTIYKYKVKQEGQKEQRVITLIKLKQCKMTALEKLDEWIKHLEFLNDEFGDCEYRLAEIKEMTAEKERLKSNLKKG